MVITHFSELDLDERLLFALYDKGYDRPTAIQATTIPHALKGRDVLALAPTGTGKTAAFLLPVLQHLLDFPRHHYGPARILILTPTRELAIQVANQACELAAYTLLNISTITGGVSYTNHVKIFNQNQDMVVATTGRLLQYIKEENFDCSAVEILILDEADRMLDMGFAQDIETIAIKTSDRRQTLLFSATLEGRMFHKFAKQIQVEPVKIETNILQQECKKIYQWYYHADNVKHKTALLIHILKQPEVKKSVIFVRKRERVHELVAWLREASINTCCYLEGKMVQAQRNKAIQCMMEGKMNILVATDIASRGLDITDITHVFNFDMPRTADIYLHRIGRTSRAGSTGIAISLIEAHDYCVLKKVSRYLNEPLKSRVIDEIPQKTKILKDKNNGKPSKKVLIKRIKENKKNKIKNKVKLRHRNIKNIGKRRQSKN